MEAIIYLVYFKIRLRERKRRKRNKKVNLLLRNDFSLFHPLLPVCIWSLLNKMRHLMSSSAPAVTPPSLPVIFIKDADFTEVQPRHTLHHHNRHINQACRQKQPSVFMTCFRAHSLSCCRFTLTVWLLPGIKVLHALNPPLGPWTDVWVTVTQALYRNSTLFALTVTHFFWSDHDTNVYLCQPHSFWNPERVSVTKSGVQVMLTYNQNETFVCLCWEKLDKLLFVCRQNLEISNT